VPLWFSSPVTTYELQIRLIHEGSVPESVKIEGQAIAVVDNQCRMKLLLNVGCFEVSHWRAMVNLPM
jgi:hypothetical protein